MRTSVKKEADVKTNAVRKVQPAVTTSAEPYDNGIAWNSCPDVTLAVYRHEMGPVVGNEILQPSIK